MHTVNANFIFFKICYSILVFGLLLVLNSFTTFLGESLPYSLTLSLMKKVQCTKDKAVELFIIRSTLFSNITLKLSLAPNREPVFDANDIIIKGTRHSKCSSMISPMKVMLHYWSAKLLFMGKSLLMAFRCLLKLFFKPE